MQKNERGSNGVESGEAFADRFKFVGFRWRKRIAKAFDWAADIHDGHFRKSGSPYIEHPVAVTSILVDELHMKDPILIIASLMHDTVEDSRFFGNPAKHPYSEWIKIAKERMTPNFGIRPTELIIALTKPKIDGVEIKSPEDVNRVYLGNLSKDPDALLLKMCDRLHNLRDISGLNAEERKKMVDETRDRYFSLFEGARAKYPSHTAYLLSEMQKAIEIIEQNPLVR